MRTIDDLDVSGRTVLVRSDLNVPLETNADGSLTITDDGRIQAAVPTIRELSQAGARVVVCSHLGRPKGEVVPGLSLAPVADRLSELLGRFVALTDDVAGPESVERVGGMLEGDVVMLENLRFEAAETSKDDAERGAFAARLADLADVYVGDGFGAVHRKHASVYDVALLLPHAAGRLVVAELDVLRRLTETPEHPYAVVLGGSKVSDKLGVIDALIERADRILVGGGMTYTFLAAQGHDVGTSLLEVDQIDRCKGYLDAAAAKGVDIILPVDVVVADRFAADAEHKVVGVGQIPSDHMGLDIGPMSQALFIHNIFDAKTAFWNGPMGVFEFPAFAAGTEAVARAMTKVEGLSVVGGGDSAAAVRTLGFQDSQFSHISTGGGASLEYLEGRELPGLTALEA